MSENEDPDEGKSRLWEVDPQVFAPLPKTGSAQNRLLSLLKTLGRFGLLGLALSYPVLLVTIGLLFGGIAFWSTFAGSALVIWVVLSRLGLARNFASWGRSGWKKSAGVFLAFPITVGFYLGLIYLKLLFLPLFLGALGIAALLLFNRSTPDSRE